MTRSNPVGLSQPEGGFALILVLWVVAMMTVVGLTLASGMRSEARVASASIEGLRAELLAESGMAVGELLSRRGMDIGSIELEGGTLEAIVENFHYRLGVPEGRIDIYFEGEDGKISLSTVPLTVIERFFIGFTGSPLQGAAIAAAIGDWRDADSEANLSGAEASEYADRGYVPRNGAFGAADPLLIFGLGRDDFRPRIVTSESRLTVQPGLDAFVTTEPSGPGIHPNFAPRSVLLSVPGMTEAVADRTIALRKTTFFESQDQWLAATGAEDTGVEAYLRFGRPTSNALLALGTTPNGVRRSVRRLERTLLDRDPLTGAVLGRRVPARFERDVFPEFISDLP